MRNKKIYLFLLLVFFVAFLGNFLNAEENQNNKKEEILPGVKVPEGMEIREEHGIRFLVPKDMQITDAVGNQTLLNPETTDAYLVRKLIELEEKINKLAKTQDELVEEVRTLKDLLE